MLSVFPAGQPEALAAARWGDVRGPAASTAGLWNCPSHARPGGFATVASYPMDGSMRDLLGHSPGEAATARSGGGTGSTLLDSCSRDVNWLERLDSP